MATGERFEFGKNMGAYFVNTFDENLKRCGIPRSFAYEYYFKNYIFEGIDIKNKSLMDFGGGNGIASFFAVHSDRSCNCTIVDPFSEGSNAQMINQYRQLSKIYGNIVKLHNDYVDTLPVDDKFDLILMHNSINHVGEDIIELVESNKEHWDQYLTRLEPVILRAKKGAHIVIADCSNKNFWNDLGIRNPLAPNIDWNLHHRPQVWRRMLKELGCSHSETRWTARREFLAPGKFMLANRFFNYFLGSHFVSVYKKCS